ncbi:substrate-binding periplasmic protein [Candidatus Galacturonibacter soehngenii]|uniref:Amino acid ABC transporter substrate-binding protein n=1 Tax=Candidatus Galacturonatibacter soehngenii TaxID=2307010 RepID=A0A7V7QNE5_9FIRM|nr:transporter substrate-binding domain-containing protein [Candidatus Galacturonibacter soehngenii]KAB1439953.1 amino acid ABC transporter substrate-binding protein [Candidatus Galacturonibacter soehngenii]MBA4685803.1 amino acid ABC transporter substrate-binding protein [Candidatus Galacturonibacter soehngenii]
MKLRKLTAVTIMTAMVFTLAACQSNTQPKESESTTTQGTEGTASEDTTSEEKAASNSLTIEDGVLQVGMEMGYPPMEYLDEDGTTPIGFDVDVAKAIGAELGLEVKFLNTAWDGIFASLDSDRFDCIISGVSIKPDREANYNLSKPYIANRVVMVTAKDSALTTPQDLSGKSVAVQTETTADDYMKELQANGLDVEILPYDRVIQCFDDLKVGRIEAVVTDSVVAAYYMGTDADKYVTAWESEEAEPMAICLKKGNDTLLAEIEKAVDTLYENGTMAELSTKYFGKDVTNGVRE